MAKTIKELATSFAFDNCERDYKFFLTEEAYTAGANAVLDEIEHYLYVNNLDGRIATDRLKLLHILNKIKELKGK